MNTPKAAPEIVIPLTWAECLALAHADAERCKPTEPESSLIPAAIPPDVARVVRLMEERYDEPLIVDLVEQVALRR